jgi:hypothetical protein
MKIPAGTELFVGPPAKPLPIEIAEQLGRALADVPSIFEAHLPMAYAKNIFDPPAQILVLVWDPTIEAENTISAIGRLLQRILPEGAFLDIVPLDEGTEMLEAVRKADCMLDLD